MYKKKPGNSNTAKAEQQAVTRGEEEEDKHDVDKDDEHVDDGVVVDDIVDVVRI